MPIEDIFRIMPVLETERLILRKMQMTDLEDMFAYSSDPEVTRYISYHHTSIEQARERIAALEEKYATGKCMVWAIEYREHKKCIGVCAFTHWNEQDKIAEIAYTLARNYWGKGFAREAVMRIMEFGFEKMNLNRIEARCLVRNEQSENLMKKCNMRFEGVLREHLYQKGGFEDVKMYSILRSEFENP